ncbi:glycosyltransferase family 2 protein [Legionella oakridgensis]|uniref:Glycosyltransferase, probably involved in cell wall biogenesis n=2 Tax=Legionella oakridgensis TaxID=29423 RepID=W0BB83_9GAMM|nr:glycosyltransferase [Legionella oakridgensis]AHE65872.1 glycosyltransferase, probably involved in cell wall biogenesis [Legionella oakridgensis ATCC 33761 = DSM 21215]KTD39032.1 Glycosyl transferase family 2 [Legionella oakridgensis]STY15806.1 Glycosyl transferase family 2 [Legionella longbeachae]
MQKSQENLEEKLSIPVRESTHSAPLSLMSIPQGQPSEPPGMNAEFLLSLIDPRPLCIPFNRKRVIWWLALTGLIASYAVLEWQTGITSSIHHALSYSSLPLMLLLLLYEPLMLAFALALVKYPEPEPDRDPLERAEEGHSKQDSAELTQELVLQREAYERNQALVVLIPCHKSIEVIRETVLSCLPHVPPKRIYVVDNGLEEIAPDGTHELIRTINSEVRYVYYGNTGNKTIALLTAIQYIHHHHPDNIQYALLIDDDVRIPRQYKVRYDFFSDEAVQGIVYPLRAISDFKPHSLLTRLQDLEYQLSDLDMAFLDRTHSVIRPHGAASLWRIKTLIEVLLHHNAVFKGDDVMMGLILQRMRTAQGPAKLRLDLNCCFETQAPHTILGPSPNLYEQRVRSWNEAQFLYFWNLSLKPLLTVWQRPCLSLLAIKNHQLYNVHAQFMHVLRLPLLIAFSTSPVYWGMQVGSSLLQGLLVAGFNYLKLPKERRNDWITVGSYPAYSWLNASFGTLSFLRVLFVSGPAAPYPRSIQTRIQHHQLALPNVAPSPKTPASDIQSQKTAMTHLRSHGLFRPSSLPRHDETQEAIEEDIIEFESVERRSEFN